MYQGVVQDVPLHKVVSLYSWWKPTSSGPSPSSLSQPCLLLFLRMHQMTLPAPKAAGKGGGQQQFLSRTQTLLCNTAGCRTPFGLAMLSFGH